jgi:hypothetical protein
MNKRRRRLLAAKQAEPRTVKLFVRFFEVLYPNLRDLGGVRLDQGVKRLRPERIAHAEIDAETVRRLHENTGKEVIE